MRLVVMVVCVVGCSASDNRELTPVCHAEPAASAGTFRFAAFGDVRPGSPNDTANYPTEIVTALFKQIAAEGAQLAVGTGDYMFASTWNGAGVDAQVALLLGAEAGFAGPVYHTLGNHECSGGTASNCPRGDETPNIRAFMAKLAPAGTPTPWYRVDVDTGRGAAKLVFVAANAWSDAQAQWLETQLADPTAYTFVIRHEPPAVTETPGVAPSDAIIHRYPITLELFGHWHRYQRLDEKHLVSGNGGAPLSFGHYGFVLVDLLQNGNLSVTEIDYATGNVSDALTICPE
jgi:hypothetical protein